MESHFYLFSQYFISEDGSLFIYLFSLREMKTIWFGYMYNVVLDGSSFWVPEVWDSFILFRLLRPKQTGLFIINILIKIKNNFIINLPRSIKTILQFCLSNWNNMNLCKSVLPCILWWCCEVSAKLLTFLSACFIIGW